MTTEVRVDLWQAARDILRAQVGDGPWGRWLEDVRPVRWEGGRVVVGVSSEFVREYVVPRYGDVMRAAVREACGEDVELTVAVVGSLPAAEKGEAPGFTDVERSALRPACGSPARVESPAEGGTTGPSTHGDHGARHDGALRDGNGVEGEPAIEDFVFGRRHRLLRGVVAELLERPGVTYNPVVIHGPAGTGKTHLLRALYRAYRGGGRCLPRHARERCVETAEVRAAELDVPLNLDVRYVTAENFSHHYVACAQDGTLPKLHQLYRELDVLIIDDFQVLLSKKKSLVEFVHTFNALADAGKQVIISCDDPPRRMTGLDDRLAGRLVGGLDVRLERPDREARLEILRRRGARLETDFPVGILEFLADSVRGSARELIGTLNQLDVHARIDRDPLDVDMARAVLSERLRDHRRAVTPRTIAGAAAGYYGLTVADLIGRSRARRVAWPRKVAMHLVRRHTEVSLAEIGRFFGGRNHATVRSAVLDIARRLEGGGDRTLAREIEEVAERFDDL